MKTYRFMAMAFALVFMAGYSGTQKSMAAPAPVPAAYGQERWEIPPGEFNEIQRRGFHDGIEGARKDYGNHRKPNVDNREEYRNSDLPPNVREVYRQGFRRGYEEAASHLWGGPRHQPPPPVAVVPPAHQDWDHQHGDHQNGDHQDWDRWGMRGVDNDAGRRGYRDGLEEARHDVQSNRNTDPDDQPQFRHPPVPPPMADEYREGFMRGYEVALSQLTGGRPWEAHDSDMNRWTPPERFSEWQRRGFHDGVDGAQKDYGNHRRPSVFNRWEYQSPRVPPEVVRDYRQGFRRGYEMAASRLWGGGM